MSIEAMSIVLHHSRAKGTAKLVLLGIANHDGDGGAWPAVATLAKYANCSPSQVQRSVSTLEQLGEVRRFVQAGGDHTYAEHTRPNRYSVTLRCPADCDRTPRHRTSRDTAPMLEIDPVAPTRPGRTDAAPPVALVRGEGVAPMRPKPPTKPTTHLPERTSPIARARAYCGHELVDDRHCTHGCRVLEHPADTAAVDHRTGEIA